MNKRVIVIFLLVFLPTFLYSRGNAGIYYINGIAYDHDVNILKNAELLITIRNNSKKIRTDENGRFEIEVFWITACPTVSRNIISRYKFNKKNNSKYIIIKYSDNIIKLKNRWKRYKYSNLYLAPSKEEVTWTHNIYF